MKGVASLSDILGGEVLLQKVLKPWRSVRTRPACFRHASGVRTDRSVRSVRTRPGFFRHASGVRTDKLGFLNVMSIMLMNYEAMKQ